jgi:hypothetical protein
MRRPVEPKSAGQAFGMLRESTLPPFLAEGRQRRSKAAVRGCLLEQERAVEALVIPVCRGCRAGVCN